MRAAGEKPVVNPLTSWIKIDGQGKITLSYSKSEMGQGISTSLPMILAEELGADWKDVQVEHAPVERAFGPQGTGGSGSVTTLYTPLRQAGAAARTMLIARRSRALESKPCRLQGPQTARFGMAATNSLSANSSKRPPRCPYRILATVALEAAVGIRTDRQAVAAHGYSRQD